MKRWSLDARSEGQSGDSLLKRDEQTRTGQVTWMFFESAYVRIDWDNPE